MNMKKILVLLLALVMLMLPGTVLADEENGDDTGDMMEFLQMMEFLSQLDTEDTDGENPGSDTEDMQAFIQFMQYLSQMEDGNTGEQDGYSFLEDLENLVGESEEVPPAAPLTAAYGTIPIYAGQAEIDYMADEILKEIPTAGKDARGRIEAVYDWIIQHCSRDEWDGSTYYFDPDLVMMMAQDYNDQMQAEVRSGQAVLRRELAGQFGLSSHYDSNFYVNGVSRNIMLTRTGQCHEFAALFTVLLGHLGIDCRLIDGDFINRDGSAAMHKWNYLLLDGTWYWCDIRMDHANYLRGGNSRAYFMKTDTAAWAQEHQWSHEYTDQLAAHPDQVLAAYGFPGGAAVTDAPVIPAGITASPSTMQVRFASGRQTAMPGYNIEGYNYFKLRDVAQALQLYGQREEKKFSVGWDDSAKTITLTQGQSYSAAGGELTPNSGGAQPAVQSSAALIINGQTQTGLAAYNINGSTYFQLRDLLGALGVGVEWNGAANRIELNE